MIFDPTSTITSSQSEPETNINKKVLLSPRAPILEPHYLIQFSIIPKTPFCLEEGSHTSLQGDW